MQVRDSKKRQRSLADTQYYVLSVVQYNLSNIDLVSPCIFNITLSPSTVSPLTALHNILVLLSSCNALAVNTLLILPLPRVTWKCWLNPLLTMFELAAEVSLTLKIISSATASQVKLTVELSVVLTDWGLSVISI